MYDVFYPRIEEYIDSFFHGTHSSQHSVSLSCDHWVNRISFFGILKRTTEFHGYRNILIVSGCRQIYASRIL